MKNLKNFLIMIIIFMFLLVGCSGKADFESRLVGTWYTEGSSDAAFSLYDDGTCEIAGEYGTGTWSVVNDNQFKLTNYYGETETATIVGIENNCLTLGDENNQVQFWNSPQISVDETEEATETVDDVNTQNNNKDEVENTSNMEKIAATSEVRIINVVEDGTLWVIEKDESGQQYIVHTNIYGDVLGKVVYEFDGYIERGIDGNLFAIEINDNDGEKINIYDINSLEEISSTYKGDFDDIISLIQTENEIVLIVRKIVESFEEKYACLKIIDISGNEIFNISLDRDTLLNEYNIEVSKSAENIEISYAGNNIYYIGYLGSAYDSTQINSLIIDLKRNKVIPVAFPYRNGLYCKSDGNYTLVHSPQHGKIIVNNETGEFGNYNNHDYTPEGALSEGVFYAISYRFGEKKAYLDTEGNIVIDLEQFP